MKKILAFTLFVLMGVVISFSQDINFHAKAGVGFANLTGDANGDPLFSYKVGVGMNIGLGGHWELHPDLFFVRKGMSNSAEVRSDDIDMKGDLTLNACYLELPVMAAYRIPLERMDVVLYAGPYLAYGVGGKVKSTVTGREDSDEPVRKITESQSVFGNGGLKRFDSGLGLGMDLEFGRFIAGINVNIGLVNLARTKDFDYDEDDIAVRNLAAHISFGYKF